MFKTKLLISLLISFIFLSCTRDTLDREITKYSLAYTGGEYDGLILNNLLKSDLSNFMAYDDNSNLRIEPNISHSTELFISNIDNTSDRMRIKSTITAKIVDIRFKCDTRTFKEDVIQFYLFADTEKYISNSVAEKKIKEENTEILVRNFINKILKTDNKCKRN
tara:strand:+ start:614 stop:1105 length:492 start_codon:yes stop_codon:yes gene_type:complete